MDREGQPKLLLMLSVVFVASLCMRSVWIFFPKPKKILWGFPAWILYDKFRIGQLRSVTAVKLTSKYSRK